MKFHDEIRTFSERLIAIMNNNHLPTIKEDRRIDIVDNVIKQGRFQ